MTHRRYTEMERDFIRENYLKMTDREIGQKLGRERHCIVTFRNRQGWSRETTGRPILPVKKYLRELKDKRKTLKFRAEVEREACHYVHKSPYHYTDSTTQQQLAA